MRQSNALFEVKMKNPKHPMWKTKDGQVMPIAKMDDNHLTNAIKRLHRRADEGITIQSGGGRDPDEMWYDEDIYHGFDALEQIPAYADLQREAHKRGIVLRYESQSRSDRFYNEILTDEQAATHGRYILTENKYENRRD